MHDLLQCPRFRLPLQPAEAGLIDKINQLIANQQLVTVEGQAVDAAICGGWYNPESGCLYPEQEGILNMLADEAFDIRNLLNEVREEN